MHKVLVCGNGGIGKSIARLILQQQLEISTNNFKVEYRDISGLVNVIESSESKKNIKSPMDHKKSN